MPDNTEGLKRQYGILHMKDICCAAFTDDVTDDACSILTKIILTGIIIHSWRTFRQKK